MTKGKKTFRRLTSLLLAALLMMSPVTASAASAGPEPEAAANETLDTGSTAAEQTTGVSYYVDATGGSDTNDGLTPEKAWKTLEKVNSVTFQPGDHILFKKGETWTGWLEPKGSGTAQAPIVIASYGDSDDKPCLKPGEDRTLEYFNVANDVLKDKSYNNVITFYNQQHWEVRDLELFDPNYTDNRSTDYNNSSTSGVYRRAINLMAADVGDLYGFTIDNCTIHGFRGPAHNRGKSSGGIIITILSDPTTPANRVPTAIHDITVTNCEMYDLGRSGFNFSSPWTTRRDAESHGDEWGSFDYSGYGDWYPCKNIYIANNIIHDIDGDGILIDGCENVLVEHNTVYRTCMNAEMAVGMFNWNSDYTVFQYNEVYDIRPSDSYGGGGYDAQGIEIDALNRDTLVQYNYCHNNKGGSLMWCNTGSERGFRGIYRYNIFQNDGNLFGVVDWRPNHVGSAAYNNTFYIGDNTMSSSRWMIANSNGGNRADAEFVNNIFYSKDPISFGNTLPGASWKNNIFYNVTGAPSDNGNQTIDPKLAEPGADGTGMGAVDGYKLAADSPAIDAGAVVTIPAIWNELKPVFKTAFNSEIGDERDYFGTELVDGEPDIGAAEFSKAADADAVLARLTDPALAAHKAELQAAIAAYETAPTDANRQKLETLCNQALRAVKAAELMAQAETELASAKNLTVYETLQSRYEACQAMIRAGSLESIDKDVVSALQAALQALDAFRGPLVLSGSTDGGMLTLSVSPSDPNLKIRYTMDDSRPTANSTPYTAPVTLPDRNITIKAMVFLGDEEMSNLFSAVWMGAIQRPEGSTYTAADPFRLPAAKGEVVRLEAEHMVLEGNGGDDYVRVDPDASNSNGYHIGWFENGNKIHLYYIAEVAGTYRVTVNYQSGRNAGDENKLNFRGAKVEAFSEDIPSTKTPSGTPYGTWTFQLVVTEAGAGSIEFYAESQCCPNLDYFDISLIAEDGDIDVSDITVTVPAGDITQIAAKASWEAVAGADSYDVQISGGSAGTGNVYQKDETGRTVKLVNLAPGVTYTVRVVAKDENGVRIGLGTADFTTKTATNAKALAAERDPEAPAPWSALPDDNQLYYHEQEMAAFIHFGPNTFNGREWGTGTESPSVFDPTNLDQDVIDGWVEQLKEAGFKRLIMVAKHHDGFCLWDSQYTDHDVMASPYGQDLLEQVSIACTKYDMDMGFYISPWDMHEETYGQGAAYDAYYMNQLREVLGNPKYGNDGVFVETWMDGAKGSGQKAQEYDFDAYFKLIRELQPQCLIYTDRADGGVRWSGNEVGTTGDPCWQRMNIGTFNYEGTNTPGMLSPWKTASDRAHGAADGVIWSVCECDVSIESGWFYSPNNSLRSLNSLIEMYLQSVGYGSPFLLNVPPTTTGGFASSDAARLAALGKAVTDTFKTDMTQTADVTATASATRTSATPGKFGAANVIDNDPDTYWTMDDGQTTGSVVIDLGETRTFDVVSIQEYIALGQRISGAKIEYRNGDSDTWHPFGGDNGQVTTIGARRIVRTYPVEADQLCVTITGSQAVPLISSIGVYKAQSGMELDDAMPEALTYVDDRDGRIGYTGTWQEQNDANGNRGTHMKSSDADATATFTFTGSLFYILGSKGPTCGQMEVTIDGGTPVIVDTNASSAAYKQVLYTSPDLAQGAHTVVIKPVVSGVRSLDFDGICFLNNGEAGVVEFASARHSVLMGEAVEVTVKRRGGSEGEISFRLTDLPGTAVQGQYYEPVAETITMADGETEKTVTVQTKTHAEAPGKVFYLQVTGAVGLVDETAITLGDPANIRQMPLGETYTEADPFLMPTAVGRTARLEAEHMELVGNGRDDYIRVDPLDSNSNGHHIGWFENGNKAHLYYYAAVAGTYKVTLGYRSGRSEGNLNTLNWQGGKVEDHAGSVPSTLIDGVLQYDTWEFEFTVTEAGAGMVEFYADSQCSPDLDYFDFELAPPQNAVVIGYTVAPTELTSGGGSVTVTLTGTDLADGLLVKVGDRTVSTTGSDTEQTATLTVPANTAQTAVTYPVQYSLDGAGFTGDKTVTVAAVPQPTTYTVNFDSQGGTDVASVTVNAGSKVTAPAAPTKTGHTFGGWYKEAACTNAWDFGTDTVTGNVTLYAKWTQNQYTVTFDSQGGANVAEQTVGYGEKAAKPADPTRTGYTFGGWFKEAACTNAWDFNTDTVTGNVTLYAKWTQNQYTVTFDSQGGDNVAEQTVGYGEKAAKPADPTRTGYTFGGWYREAACTNAWNFDTDTVTGNVTLYARWTAVDKSGLTDAINAANAVKENIVTGATAAEVAKDTEFVTEDEMTALTDAIASAKAIEEKADATQAEVDAAVTALNNAVNTFRAAIKTGTYTAPVVPVAPATPPTTTETKENEDGSTTTTVTDNKTGTVTETTEKEDGAVEVVETRKDGTVTETTEKPDGSTEVVETKPDGTVTETATDPEGGKVEKITTPEVDVTITVTDAEGEVLAKVELPNQIPAVETRFEDVPEGHWADEAIHSMAALEIVNGVGNDRFDMTSDMTRGALATVLSRLSHGQEGLKAGFADVDADEWYADGIAWAAKTGVVTGYSATEFGPNDPITREQLAVMLCRYARLLGMDTTADSAALDSFSDGSATHDWAADSIAWCVDNGILKGMGNGTLAPTATATRAQVSVMLQRFIDLMK